MSTSEALAQRIASAHRRVTAMKRQFRLGAWLTAIVGIILLGLLIVYFTFGYQQVSILTKPDTLVPWVGDMLDSKIKDAVPALENEVTRSAPAWAELASQQIVASLPLGREKLQELLLAKTGDFVSKHTVLAEDMFRKVLKEHRATIKETLDQLSTKQALSDELLASLQTAVEAEIKVEMQAQAHELLEAFIEMDAKLQRLKQGTNLSPEEQIERRLGMTARRLANEQSAPVLSPPAPRK